MTKSTAWLRFPEPVPQARVQLFCFPYAGAGISVFRGWSALLRPDVEVCLVQLPGREDRLQEPRFTRLTDLLPPLLAALRPSLDRPFAFFGHSLGGAVAFELARALQEAGGPQPIRVCISARRVRQFADSRPPLHTLPDAGFLQAIQHGYESIPAVILRTPELLDLYLRVLRADLEMSETHVSPPMPALDCPISVFGGLGDRLVQPDDLEGWSEQTTGDFTLTLLPGDHFFLKSAQPDLLNNLRATLATDLEGSPRVRNTILLRCPGRA
jgi:surfactin synthase thioesterase subunit